MCSGSWRGHLPPPQLPPPVVVVSVVVSVVVGCCNDDDDGRFVATASRRSGATVIHTTLCQPALTTHSGLLDQSDTERRMAGRTDGGARARNR